jgi:cubilin
MPSAIRPNLQCSDSSICNENAQCTQPSNSPPMCICRPGFTGNGYGPAGCVATAYDPCISLGCKNGGICIKNLTSVFCQCPRGTQPPLCERVDSCASNPCLNGGNCTNTRRAFGRGYNCACPKSFQGRNCENQVKKCGGLRNDLNGTLRYPEDPNAPYQHNSRCAWLIKTNHTKVLNVTFTKFNLEAGNDCKFDWLQVICGQLKFVCLCWFDLNFRFCC